MKTTKLDYQNGNIGKLFRSLFFPTLIGMLSNSVFLITDGIFVGQGIGPLGLAAVNMVAPMFILICGITYYWSIFLHLFFQPDCYSITKKNKQ